MDALPEPLFGAQPIAPRRLADGVLAELSAAVLDGRLPEGGRLPSEAGLAQRFGVSKQVVREAIRHLAGLGVLEVFPGRATRVRALDAEPLARFWRFAVGDSRTALAEAVELRRLVEPPLARLAARRANDDDRAALAAAFARMQAALGDVPTWIEADLDFHEAVARAAHNRLALLQVRGLRPVVALVMRRFNDRESRSQAAWRATLRRHARVLAAIDARDAAAAEAAMLAHFAAADAAIAELFGPAPNARTKGGRP
jgi:GntR family transcriptional repressor for pyruvate dehydrogenase complex